LGPTRVRCFLFALAGLLVTAAPPAAAVEQCRFIGARQDREACYKRQEEELEARRKPELRIESSKQLESLQQMRRDDEEVYRSIRGICSGC